MSKYELWEVPARKKADVKRLFVRSDHNGDRLREKLPKKAKKTWECEAETFHYAMVAYWEHMDRGEYISTRDHIFPGDELC